MPWKILRLIILIILFSAIKAQAQVGSYSVEIGESHYATRSYRLAMQQDFNHWLAKKNIPLTGYFDLSINSWRGKDDNLYALALSPVFNYQLCSDCKYQPYLEFGIGTTLLSSTRMDHKELSSKFQFEDRLGLGLRFDNFDLHLRYLHYSNAGMQKPNDGISFLSLGFTFDF